MVLPILLLVFLPLVLSFRRTLFGELGRLRRKRGFLRWSRNNVPRLVVNFARVLLLFLVVPRSYLTGGLTTLR